MYNYMIKKHEYLHINISVDAIHVLVTHEWLEKFSSNIQPVLQHLNFIGEHV